MPYTVDGIGGPLTSAFPGTGQLSNNFVQSLGFSRSEATSQGASRLGTDATRSGIVPQGYGLTPQGNDIRDTGHANFGDVFADAVQNLQHKQRTASELGVRAVTGQLDDVHDYTIAATESQLTMELTSTLRNKAVDMFNEMMRMQA